MKRAAVVLRSFGLTSLLLAGTTGSYAGLCLTNPNASKQESARYYDQETSIKQEEVQANIDYANDKLLCKGSLSCMMQAQRKFQKAQNNIRINRNNNNATHQKALIDIQAASDVCNVKAPTESEQDEYVRHFRAEIDIKKQEVDVNTKYDDAKINCGADRNCVIQAGKTYADDQLRLQVARNNENATHMKNLIAIVRNEQRPKSK